MAVRPTVSREPCSPLICTVGTSAILTSRGAYGEERRRAWGMSLARCPARGRRQCCRVLNLCSVSPTKGRSWLISTLVVQILGLTACVLSRSFVSDSLGPCGL